ANCILENNVARIRYPETNRRPLAGRNTRLGLLEGDAAAGPGVPSWPSFGQRRLSLRVQLRHPAEAAVRVPGIQQLGGVRAVHERPLGLPVGSTGSADIGPLVPIQTEPAQVLKNRRFRFGAGAIDVGILDAEDERTTMPARQKPVEQRRARAAHMQLPGRTWSESDAHKTSGSGFRVQGSRFSLRS